MKPYIYISSWSRLKKTVSCCLAKEEKKQESNLKTKNRELSSKESFNKRNLKLYLEMGRLLKELLSKP